MVSFAAGEENCYPLPFVVWISPLGPQAISARIPVPVHRDDGLDQLEFGLPRLVWAGWPKQCLDLASVAHTHFINPRLDELEIERDPGWRRRTLGSHLPEMVEHQTEES